MRGEGVEVVGHVVRAGSNTHARNVEGAGGCEMRGSDSLPVRYYLYYFLASISLLTYRQAFTRPFCDFEAVGSQ